MIQSRSTERTWREEREWPAAFLPGIDLKQDPGEHEAMGKRRTGEEEEDQVYRKVGWRRQRNSIHGRI